MGGAGYTYLLNLAFAMNRIVEMDIRYGGKETWAM